MPNGTFWFGKHKNGKTFKRNIPLLSQHTPSSIWASFLCGSSRSLYSVCGLQMGSQIPWSDWLFHGQFHGQIHLKIAHLVVTGPLVWMDYRSLGNMLLQNREESGNCSVWHNLHEPQCWWLSGVYMPKTQNSNAGGDQHGSPKNAKLLLNLILP